MPSTAADLLARIQNISSAITQQKNVLKDLEKTKSELQSQLNAVCDPVSHLPLELSSQIFLLCLPEDEFPKSSRNAAPLVFLNVSHAWSDIALATPTLWSSVSARSPYHEEFPELLKLWFERAGMSLLSVALSFHLRDDWEAVYDVVRTNADPVRGLELNLFAASFSAHECAKMVCAVPNLEQCTIEGCLHRSGAYVGPIHTLHALLDLRLGSNERGSKDYNAEFLRFVDLPALQTLSLVHFRHPPAELLDYLNRSAPPLQSLDMHLLGPWSVPDVRRLFELVPSLTSIVLRCHAEMAEHFIQVLADGELPNVQNISLHRPLFTGQHTSLISMLTARRRRLQTFRWMIHRHDLPDAWVHVGPERKNELLD
ncbi:hypothetical protein C8R43DRAFT_994291 [Mycena crocata]|nr:hypothetical protein C8R43DRAFT_994291 [Mycena crocata]